jgi:hypothetical protein
MLTEKATRQLVLVGALLTLFGRCPYVDAQSEETEAAASTRPIFEIQFGSAEGLGFKFPHLALGARIERSITREFEADIETIYSPDRKYGLNSGHQITVEANGIYWAVRRIGLLGGYEHNWLVTPDYKKSVTIPYPGIVFRGRGGFPWRLYLSWLIPLGQYDPKTGIEPSRLTGPDFLYESQFSEHFRFGLRMGIYHGYEQGNAACDGNAPNPQHLPPCPRTGYTTGQSSFIFRFTRKQSTETAY